MDASSPSGPTSWQGPVSRQEQVLAFVRAYRQAHGGNSPSLREIAAALRLSKSTVESYLGQLSAAGRIVRQDGKFWLSE